MDWFRNTEWSQEIERSFFARLGRSRTDFHKSQYLRIQAVHLAATGRRDLVQVAMRLVDTLLADYPHEMELASAYHQRGQCRERLGDRAGALRDFERAVITERTTRSIKTSAALDFAWLVMTGRASEFYDKAVQFAFEYESPFPIDIFRRAAVLAFIAADRGDIVGAKAHAREAVDAADRSESGLRYHKTLGLMGSGHAGAVEKLRRLAAE